MDLLVIRVGHKACEIGVKGEVKQALREREGGGISCTRILGWQTYRV